MKDQKITICVERGYYFGGEIENGSLSLVSEIYGDDFESERHYEFSQQETTRLFEIVSVDEFVEICKQKGSAGLDDFLREHHIICQCVTI